MKLSNLARWLLILAISGYLIYHVVSGYQAGVLPLGVVLITLPILPITLLLLVLSILARKKGGERGQR